MMRQRTDQMLLTNGLQPFDIARDRVVVPVECVEFCVDGFTALLRKQTQANSICLDEGNGVIL